MTERNVERHRCSINAVPFGRTTCCISELPTVVQARKVRYGTLRQEYASTDASGTVPSLTLRRTLRVGSVLPFSVRRNVVTTASVVRRRTGTVVPVQARFVPVQARYGVASYVSIDYVASHQVRRILPRRVIGMNHDGPASCLEVNGALFPSRKVC